MTEFVGRAKQLAFLRRAYDSDKSELIPIYGRRRVGKTTLIAESLSGRDAFFYTGRRLPRDQQLKAFTEAAAEEIGDSLLAEVAVTSWHRALTIVVERLERRAGESAKSILVLDEFQWMVEQSPDLLSELQQLWDRHWQHKRSFVLILCGSYVGFMEREVLAAKSPLYGRRTGSIRLPPLTAAEARCLHPSMTLEDAAKTYFICGGVPSYHLAFSSKRSFRQNIAQAFFEMGPLCDEPAFLLREELREVATYSGVLTALAPHGTTRKELAATVGVSESNMSFYLDQLTQLGYVRRRYPLSGRRPSSRQVRFVLADPLLRFWFRFVERATAQAVLTSPAQAVQAVIAPNLDSYLGSCFEELCRTGLSSLYALESVSAPFEIGEFWSKDVQIDLVGLRDDGITDIGECKWGAVSSRRALEATIHQKMRAYPNHGNATLVGRAFVRRHPRVRKSASKESAVGEVLWHSLEDLYTAQDAQGQTVSRH